MDRPAAASWATPRSTLVRTARVWTPRSPAVTAASQRAASEAPTRSDAAARRGSPRRRVRGHGGVEGGLGGQQCRSHGLEADAGRVEGLGIYRSLAEANPAAWLPDLAMPLNNLSVGLADADRRGEALAVRAQANAAFSEFRRHGWVRG